MEGGDGARKDVRSSSLVTTYSPRLDGSMPFRPMLTPSRAEEECAVRRGGVVARRREGGGEEVREARPVLWRAERGWGLGAERADDERAAALWTAGPRTAAPPERRRTPAPRRAAGRDIFESRRAGE